MNSSDSQESYDEFEDEDKSGSDNEYKPWNPKDIRITTKTFTIREIFTQITENELDLAPDFQRSFVWKNKQQVRLIESILLGIPLPAFYFNQDRTGEHQVIDGVQRLTTIKQFMSDKLVLEEKNLEYLSALKDQRYSSLEPSIKGRFAKTQIVAHVIEPQTPDEVKYDIFNRVNTGGSPLSAQEIRHCMSKATSRNFLTDLVTSKNFDSAMGSFFWTKDESGKSMRDNKRMADREMALRFCSFSTIPIEDYAKAASLDTFLMQFTRSIDYQNNSSTLENYLKKMKDKFECAMKNCHEILGENAFRRYPIGATRRGPVNRAIFESQAITLSNHSFSELKPYKKEIEKMFRALFDNPEYDDSVRFSTGSYTNVKRRLDIPRKELKKILS